MSQTAGVDGQRLTSVPSRKRAKCLRPDDKSEAEKFTRVKRKRRDA